MEGVGEGVTPSPDTLTPDPHPAQGLPRVIDHTELVAEQLRALRASGPLALVYASQ